MAGISRQVRIPLEIIYEYESIKFPKEFNVAKSSFNDFAKNAIVEKIEKLKEAAAKEKR